MSTMDELYDAAKAEGGKLVVYAGGDAPEQTAVYTTGFADQYPELEIEVTVDLSKYHDARIDAQRLRGDNRVDVAHIQTLQDFPYWKQHGLLAPFKPDGFENLVAGHADPDGTYYPLFGYAFSNVVDTRQIPAADAPREATDYLHPDLAGKIVLTYPHDDDAVLFMFEQIIAKHGIAWLQALLRQDPIWVRGTAEPTAALARGEAAVSFTTAYFLNAPDGDPLRFQLPREDFFQGWFQAGGILAAAPHPSAARLYMNYRLSHSAQAQSFQWPVRTDIEVPGWKPLADYPNTDPKGFETFMRDRARAERFRGVMEDIIGPVQGSNPTGVDRRWH